MTAPTISHDKRIDASNPYFQFEPAKCIVCSRCVRACEEVQGTFALTVQGRGFASKIAAGMDEPFLTSECVSCGACVQACPTATLIEKTVVDLGQPEHSVVTTCAYCGVGCSFKAEMRGDTVVRMVPWKDGKANHGHSCVKGRFAWGYANHQDRILKPMVREKITDPWREVSWEEAIGRVASEFRRIQAQHGKDSIGVITSSRCTDEETLPGAEAGAPGVRQQQHRYLRAGVPLADRLWIEDDVRHLGRHAEFRLRRACRRDACVVGANPTDGHPVFASRMKQRLREGAKLIVVDPRRIDMVRTPHVEASHHLALRPGTNVAVLTALAHVIVTEGLVERRISSRERCDRGRLRRMGGVRLRAAQQPGGSGEGQRRARRRNPCGGAAVRRRAQRRDLLRAWRHGTQPGQHRGDGARQPGDGDRQYRPPGVGVNPLRGQNNVQGSCDMGSFPHELPGYRHVSDAGGARDLRTRVGRGAGPGAGPAHSQHDRRRAGWLVQGHLHPGRGHRAVGSRHASTSPPASRRWNASWCTTCS